MNAFSALPSTKEPSPLGRSWVNSDAGSPITYGEMHALLEPLQSCLARIERTLQDIPRNAPPAPIFLRTDAVPHPFPTLPVEAVASEPPPREGTPREETPREGMQREGVKGLRRSKSLCEGDADGILLQENGEDTKTARLDVAKILKEEGLADEITVVDQVALKLEKSARWWAGIHEPVRHSLIYRTATSPTFENLCMAVIVFNSGLVAYSADWQVQNIGKKEPKAFDIAEKFCFCWFLLELLIRLGAHRLHFFINSEMQWNIFDLILVSISVIDFVFDVIASVQEGSTSNVAFMRILRLLKLARIFRSLRSFRFFKSLELLLESFQRSFVSLFWGMVMLAFVLYLFTLIFLQACIEYLNSGDMDPTTESLALDYFGSFGLTWLSLYMSVTGGDDWGNLYKVIAATGWIYGLLLVFFTFFFLFALFNILTGSLVEKAMTTSKPDRTDLILKKRKSIAEEKKQFLRLCTAMDQDGSKTISWEEFQKWMCNPVMLAYMASIGIEIYDVELFFNTVAAREGRHGTSVPAGEVSMEHFVEGCMHMKGTATALDMQRQLHEMHILHHDLKQTDVDLKKRFQVLEQLMNQCCWMVSSTMDQHMRSSTMDQDMAPSNVDHGSVDRTLDELQTARSMMRNLDQHMAPSNVDHGSVDRTLDELQTDRTLDELQTAHSMMHNLVRDLQSANGLATWTTNTPSALSSNSWTIN